MCYWTPQSAQVHNILWPGAPTPANVYAVIERHKPTLFYSVPTGYGMLLAHQRPGADTSVGPYHDLQVFVC